MKVLVIVTHPDIEGSVVNKRWIEELEKYPKQITVHQLYKAYPDEQINIEAEQKLIEAYDKIVFQFPVYWFSSPPLLKKWFDEVLIEGWAFGSKSEYGLEHKKIGLALSAGSKANEYSVDGRYKATLKQVILPFELIFNYIKANYSSFFVTYGLVPKTPNQEIEKSVSEYLDFINKF